MIYKTLLSWALALMAFASVLRAEDKGPPPNAPARAEWNAAKGELTIEYHGSRVFHAAVTARNAAGTSVPVSFASTTSAANEKVEQTFTLTPSETGAGTTLVLSGIVTGSSEAFPAETESEAQKRFPMVRNCAGLSRNLRNNAVYDRHGDWVLAGPADGTTRVWPKTDHGNGRTFELTSQGESIQLAFRPRFYQKHLGYRYFEPWTYAVWKGSLTGYCTWWAYRAGFTQETLDGMLKVFMEKHLPDFGYEYMQFDNCYQIGNGSCPENWLHWDERKYPGGWQRAMKSIRDAEMKPGIWVHRIHRPSDPHVKQIAAAHPDWFVRRADGSLVQHRGFYMLNTSDQEAVDNMVRKLYRGLKEQGWEYVKIDGTGDLLRAYQNLECVPFFEKHPSTSPEDSLRKWDIVAREELGPEVYILACHTVANARKVIGLVDGGRLSNDGFQPQTLAQYNNLEGVVWRGDPDHCDVLGEWLMDLDAEMRVFGQKDPVPMRTIVRPAVCTMAGAVLMLSDKLEVYQDDGNLEGMKRSAPVLFTVPGQLYSCGHQANAWWLQEIDRPFDHWSVLARIQWGEKRQTEWAWDFKGRPPQEVKFADLGLADDRDYVVFEFWSQKYLGKARGSFIAPAMDDNNGMQVFAIREAREHPWILSTSRHISQGGVSLLDERWDGVGNVLSGKSKVVVGDPYVLTVRLPEGFQLANVIADGEEAEYANLGEVAKVRITPSTTRTLDWKMRFARQVN